MSRSSPALVAVGGLILALLAAPVAVATVQSDTPTVPYGIDSPSEVDVTDSVIMIGYEHYSFDGIARLERGEDLVVRATAPRSAVYGVDLYNSDRQPVAFSGRALRGNGSMSFDTESLVPGSYMAVLVDDMEIKAVLPVVVEGYAVSVDGVPDTVEAGTDLTLTATVSKHPGSPESSRVELVVFERTSGYMVTRREMTADGQTYSATVELDAAGEYEVYVNVRGQKEVRGREVLLGFSDPRTFSVTGAPDPAGTSGGNGGTVAPGATASAASPEPVSQSESTDAPEGVITRNATLGASSAGDRRPMGTLPVLFALFLVGGLLYWFRR